MSLAPARKCQSVQSGPWVDGKGWVQVPNECGRAMGDRGRNGFECHLTRVPLQGLLQHLLCFVVFLQLQEQLRQLAAQEVLSTDLLGSLIVINGLSANGKHRPQFGSGGVANMPCPFSSWTDAQDGCPMPTGSRPQALGRSRQGCRKLVWKHCLFPSRPPALSLCGQPSPGRPHLGILVGLHVGLSDPADQGGVVRVLSVGLIVHLQGLLRLVGECGQG